MQAKILGMFERYQRVKFEVAEFMNFKWLYLGIYLKLGDKWGLHSDTKFNGLSECLSFHSF